LILITVSIYTGGPGCLINDQTSGPGVTTKQNNSQKLINKGNNLNIKNKRC